MSGWSTGSALPGLSSTVWTPCSASGSFGLFFQLEARAIAHERDDGIGHGAVPYGADR
jgi:hypothetical protein